MALYINAAVPLLILITAGLIVTALYLRNELTILEQRLAESETLINNVRDSGDWRAKRLDHRLTQMYAEHQSLKKWAEHEIDLHRSRLDLLDMQADQKKEKTESLKNVAIAAKVSRKPRKVRV